MLILAVGSASAQHKIDLSQVQYPEIEYLNLGNPGPTGKEIRVNNLYMEEGGVPLLPVMGEIHYNRMDARYWRDALLKMKASGINIVATYCIWNLHEEFEGELSWKGNLDLRRFILLCDELGLKVHLRIGPYCNAEIRNGGLPDWIVNNANLETRSNDPLYLAYSRRWYESIFEQVRGLLYKDGGPIMAIQLENEYVKHGQIIPHLTTLKQMAVDIGFDVPIYSMTHWMDSEYPKGEIIPYAGFYIEAPWTAHGKEEIPTGNFEFFTYNRLSDNIGTDIIKLDGDVESLSGEGNDSPFFTCEIGVGTTAFYQRRAVVPEEMAGEMINLRLGCGANLIGYYMYTGGTNPIGKATTMQSSGPRVSYDYQAPIREYGTLGTVMQEVKKYNYFMNDWGTDLAPMVAYLPTSNQKRENLQWVVRSDGKKGYLFCSNYLYKHDREDYKKVQFTVKLKEETIRMPRQKTTVKGGTYFFWPFNLELGGIQLKYATAQPVCWVKEGKNRTYFFFEDDAIPAEYALAGENIAAIQTSKGICQKEKQGYFIHSLDAGRDCLVEIKQTDGSVVRLVTLTEEESDQIWKGELEGKEFVALTSSALIVDKGNITLIDESPSAQVSFFQNGGFMAPQCFQGEARNLRAKIQMVSPLSEADYIAPAIGEELTRVFRMHTFSEIEEAWLRYVSIAHASCEINGTKIESHLAGDYQLANVTKLLTTNLNTVTFHTEQPIAAEVEILLKNGQRILWNTDATWLSSDKKSAQIAKVKRSPLSYAPEEHLAVYKAYVLRPVGGEEETRLYIDYRGDVANLYQNEQLIADSYYDGTDWIVSVDRLQEAADVNPLVIRIKGLESADVPIYFEKEVNPADCVYPTLKSIDVKQEYRFQVVRK